MPGVRGPDGIRRDPFIAQETFEAEVQHQFRPQEDVPKRRFATGRGQTSAGRPKAAAGQTEEDAGIAGRQCGDHVGGRRNRGTKTDGE